MERRPIFAGVLLGPLTYKPHLGLLFPIALVAADIGACLSPPGSLRR
jgi:hypothetical protein